jgi:hypothetical protein
MQARVVSVGYDAAQGAWEARVDVERQGRTFRYPCRLVASNTVSRDWLEAALTRQALAMSDTPLPSATAPRASLFQQFSDALARALHPRAALSDIPVQASEPRRPQPRP